MSALLSLKPGSQGMLGMLGGIKPPPVVSRNTLETGSPGPLKVTMEHLGGSGRWLDHSWTFPP